jgi:hypothetical protein
MLENRRIGPGVERAASIEKCGNAHTGMLKIVRSGRSALTRRAAEVAPSFVHTGPPARTT